MKPLEEKERCSLDHEFIWPLTCFNVLSWTDEGAVFHNLKLGSAFNIWFIYRGSVRDHHYRGKIFDCIREK